MKGCKNKMNPRHFPSSPGHQDTRYFPPPLPDYTAAAVLALFLYFLGYLPGLFYTIFKLVDALQYSSYYKHYYGRRPAGIGCLLGLLVGWILGPIIVLGAFYFAFPAR
jgi:hypothetical protein